LFQQTFSVFKPFVPPRGGATTGAAEIEKAPEPAADDGNIDELRRQMKDMQDRLDRMSKEPKSE
jgi:polyhydroxyalkanoate synthesis regulator protein